MSKVLFVALALLALFGAAAAQLSEPQYRAEFERFEHKFQKQYKDAVTREARFQIFRVNLARATELNTKAGRVAHGVTKFSDMTPSELSHFTTYKRSSSRVYSNANEAKPIKSKLRRGAIPDSFDWREHNAVTPVRDQGQCGSCWAFSATEQVESAMLLKYHNASAKTSWLSAQQIVDCDVGASDYGCNGGDTITAFAYLIKAQGMESERTYTYKAQDGTCKYDVKRSVTQVTGWSWAIPSCEKDPACDNQSETDLAATMAVKGPASICVAASDDWFSYTGGVYAGASTHGYFDLNHCIQLVGVAKTSESQGYWIARNSWGESWGDKGYIYLPFGENNSGLADEVTFVEVA